MKTKPKTYIVSGRKKIQLTVMNTSEEIVQEGHDIVHPFNPSDRHVQTGKPDGRWVEGDAHSLKLDVVVLAKDYMKRKRFELPQWCGLMLSYNGNDYRIHSTSYVRAGDFVQVSIWAKRFKEIRKVISYF